MKLRAVWIAVCLVGLLAIAGAAASTAAAESLCTDTWTGPAEGAWETASDWSLGRAPSSLDVACIGSGKAVHVSSGSQAAAVVQGEGTLEIWSGGSLELASAFEVSRMRAFTIWTGSLTGAGTLEVSGSFEWHNEGTLAGSGSLVVAKGATGTVYEASSPVETHVVDRPLVNEGTLTENAKAGLRVGEGAVITNRGTIAAHGFSISQGSGATSTLLNDGTVDANSSGGFQLTVKLENEGLFVSEGPEVDINGGCSSGSKAEWSQATGTIAAFFHSCSFNGGTWSGGGSLVFWEPVSISNVNAEKATAVADTSMTVEPGTITMAHFALGSHGELNGPGNLKISGTFKWNEEGVIKGSGTTTLESGATGEIRSEALNVSLSMTIENHTFVNEGTMTLTGEAAHLAEKGSAVFKNLGTFIANKNVTESPYEAKAKFVNRGAFRKTNDPWGTGETIVSVPFENYGRVEVLAGKIKIEHPIAVDSKTKRGGRNRSALSSLNCKLGDPVSCETGNFYESQTDIAIGGRGLGLNLTRTYNAQAAAAGEQGAFGYGWTNSFSAHLTFNTEAHTVTAVQDEGATVTFAEEGGKLVAPAWTQDTLTGNSSEGYTLTVSNLTVYRFSGVGRLESVTDRNGNATSLGYNEKGQLATITDPSGRKVTLAYNAEGLVESATDPMSHVVKYAYEARQLVSVTLPNQTNPRWRFKYDASHRITGVVDGRGNETTNTYNSANQVIAQKDFAGHLMKWEYEPFITKVTNESTGSVTLEEYTSEDQISAVTRGYGTSKATTESFTYGEHGEPLTRTDGNGHTTAYEYDGEGNKVKQTDPEGHEIKWTYNSKHEIASETLPSGETTTIEYDERGNPTRVSRPAPEEKTQTTRYEYNSHGAVTAMIDPLERKWTYGYDEAGDRTSETDPEGDKTTRAYNKDSQQTNEVSPRGNVTGGKPSEYTTTFTRDALGRVTKITHPEGQETKYGYNADSNPTEVTDPSGHKTTINYTPDELPSKVTQANGSVAETTYNGANLVTVQIDGNKHTTKYVRNVLGQITEVIDPLEHKTKETYDGAGNVSKVTDAASRTITYSYNKENQPTKITYSESATPTVEYGYNANGQVASMSDGTGITSYTRDHLGRLTETKNGHGDVIGYGYDLAGEITSVRYPNGKTVKDGYDKAGRLSSVSDWLSHTVGFAYNPDSQPITTSFPESSGESDHYTYNRTDQLTEASMLKGTETLASLAYVRDLNGQITKETQTGLPGEAAREDGYDVNERLTKAGATAYEYDPANNPTKIGTTTNTFNAADQLTEGGGVTYAYDNVGERIKATPTSGPASTYGYNQAGVLTSVNRLEEGSIPKIEDNYAYDGNALRASETVNGATRHLTWQLTGLPLLLSDGTNSYIYGPSGFPVEQISSEEHATYLHHDQQGSTRLLTSEAGSVQGTYSFGAYGETTAHTGTATTPLGYDGQYTSADTGLIYLQARVYDPATAQFLSVDPLVATTRTPYLYGADNPLAFADPSGKDFMELPWEVCLDPEITLGCAVGGAAIGIGALIAGEESVEAVSSILEGSNEESPGLLTACEEIPSGALPGDKALGKIAKETGISKGKLSDALHKIKYGAGLKGDDNTRIDSEGNVYNEETGEWIGNVIEEAHG